MRSCSMDDQYLEFQDYEEGGDVASNTSDQKSGKNLIIN